jgi:hypothetical protein
MLQFLQQVPWLPMLQAFMVTARSKIVSTPSFCARSSISRVAGSMLAVAGSAILAFLAAFLISFTSAIRGSSSML